MLLIDPKQPTQPTQPAAVLPEQLIETASGEPSGYAAV